MSYTLLIIVVYIASLLLDTFRAPGDIDKFLWCMMKVPKMFYCPISVFTGLWHLLVDDTLKEDVVNGTTKTAFVAIYVYVDFNFCDSVIVTVGKLLYGN